GPGEVADRDHLGDADDALGGARDGDLGLALLLAGERLALLRAFAAAVEVTLHEARLVGLADDLSALLLLRRAVGSATRGRTSGGLARRTPGRSLTRRRNGLPQVDLPEDLDRPHLLEARRRGRTGPRGRRRGSGRRRCGRSGPRRDLDGRRRRLRTG